MISEETLSAAVKEYAKEFYATLPETAECDHTFSPEFEKKMRHLCHKTKYKPAYTFLKRMACAVVALILCASAFLALNTEARASLIGWITEKYNSYIRYSFSEKDHTSAFSSYDFEKIPDGCIFVERADTDSGTSLLYISEDGRFLSLSYYFNTDGGELFFKPEDHTLVQENIDGIAMDIYLSENLEYNSAILWIDNEVLFVISANCDKDILIALAQSVRPIN